MQIIKNTRLIAILLILLVLTSLYTYGLPYIATGEKGAVSSKIYLYFEGADKGLDPKGKKFDIYEIKKNEVLDLAIKNSELADKITPDELANLITIKPIVPLGLLDKMTQMPVIVEKSKTEEIKQIGYYPNEYIIGIKDKGAVTKSDMEKLLSNLLVDYKSYFEDKYLVQPTFEPMLSEEDILAYDYPEMVQALDRETESILNFINAYSKLAPDYRSQETGISFGDLYEKTNLIKSVNLREINGLVSAYTLTKDYAQRIHYNEYLIKRVKLTQDKKEDELLSIGEMFNQYENDSSLIVLSQNLTGINLAPENEFYNKLVNDLAQVGIASTNAKYKIEDIRQAITKLQANQLDQATYETITTGIKADVSNIIQKVKSYREEAKTLATEYYYNKYIQNSIALSESVNYSRNTNGNVIINFVALVLLVIILVLLYYRFIDTRKLKTAKRKATAN